MVDSSKMLKKIIKSSLINFGGNALNKKVVIFESDDWGAIRTVAPKYQPRYQQRVSNSQNPYLRFDTLASIDDLSALFEVLKRNKDCAGNSAQITFNTVVANPDFDKIRESNYEQYFFEPFTNTLDRYYPNQDVWSAWNFGIDERLIVPQFHGREHVNVPVWLSLLRNQKKEFIELFELGTWSNINGVDYNTGIKLQASLDYRGNQPVEYQKSFISEGLHLFKKLFNENSCSMIPNNFICPLNLLGFIKKHGVKMMQGMKYQKLPFGDKSYHATVRRKFGSREENGLVFNVRNCIFEPSQTSAGYDDVGECLREISNAFFFNKPAVISTHRLCFIGAIHESNRKENLAKLDTLLKKIVLKWPDVVFANSRDLYKLHLLDNKNEF